MGRQSKGLTPMNNLTKKHWQLIEKFAKQENRTLWENYLHTFLELDGDKRFAKTRQKIYDFMEPLVQAEIFKQVNTYDLRLNRCWSFTPYGLVMLIPRNIEPEPDYIELMEYAGMA